VERAARLVLQFASGRADALTGRFLTTDQDLHALIAHTEEIAAADLYTLRVWEVGRGGRRLSSGLPSSTNLHDRRLPAIPSSRYNAGKGSR
jgi:hypothetical protein